MSSPTVTVSDHACSGGRSADIVSTWVMDTVSAMTPTGWTGPIADLVVERSAPRSR